MAINFPDNPTTGQSIYVAGCRYVYNGYAWTRAIVSGQVGSRKTQTFTATAGQTAFVSNLELQNFEVFLNGLKLDSTDYSAANGTLTLVEALELNDNLEIIEYGAVDVMQDVYRSSDTEPTNVNNGYIWYDENTNEVKVKTPSGFQILSNNTSYNANTFTAAAAQDTFLIDHTPGYVQVHLNGFKLSSDEFTSNGTSIVLGQAAEAGDIVDIIAFTNFTMSDQLIKEGSFDISTTNETVIDTFDNTVFRSAEYLLSYSNATNTTYGSSKILVQHNGTVVNFTEYGSLGDDFCTFNADINGNQIELKVTTTADTNVKFTKVLGRI